MNVSTEFMKRRGSGRLLGSVLFEGFAEQAAEVAGADGFVVQQGGELGNKAVGHQIAVGEVDHAGHYGGYSLHECVAEVVDVLRHEGEIHHVELQVDLFVEARMERCEFLEQFTDH